MGTLRICLAGGGSGGHLYPCIATAQAIERRCSHAQLLLIGARRAADRARLAKHHWPYRLVSARALPYGNVARRLLNLAWLAWSQLEAVPILRRFRPDVLVATGGYVSAGVVPAARVLRIPVVLHESDAVPGRTTRLLARHAAAITVGFQEALQVLPSEKTHFVGQPIRSDVLAPARDAGREMLGLSAHAHTLLVTGGSYGARSLNEATVDALPELLSNGAIQVLHVAGEADHPRTAESVSRRGIESSLYHLVPYLDDMGHALAVADLVLCRAGANTMAEVAARRIPAVVVPYPHAAAHQEANTRPFVDAGAAIMVPDAELSGERLAALVRTLLGDEQRRQRMAEAAEALSQPNAADAIADIAISLARHRSSRP